MFGISHARMQKVFFENSIDELIAKIDEEMNSKYGYDQDDKYSVNNQSVNNCDKIKNSMKDRNEKNITH